MGQLAAILIAVGMVALLGAIFMRAKAGRVAKVPFVKTGEAARANSGDISVEGNVVCPSPLVAPFSGDRGDISAKHVWKDGVWTVVVARKLVTNSEFDVQFNDMKKGYAFGVAIFDNAQVRHAYHTGVLQMTLE